MNYKYMDERQRVACFHRKGWLSDTVAVAGLRVLGLTQQEAEQYLRARDYYERGCIAHDVDQRLRSMGLSGA